MKKYLSMKYLVGVFALLAAFGMQSFQKGQEKKAKADTEEMVWFPASSQNQTSCNPENFNLSNGTKVEDTNCNPEKEYCCAIGYPESDCQDLGGGIYRLNDEPANPGTIVRYDE